MTYYGYTSTSYDSTDSNDSKQSIVDSARKLGYRITTFIEDPESNRTNWIDRQLHQLINQTMQPGDTLIVQEASSLARSTSQVLDILEDIRKRELHLYFTKYDKLFPGDHEASTQEFLNFVQNIESDFVSRRVSEALARRKAAGLPIGRPKGRRNKTLKLDKHYDQIQHYLNLHISRASIAKLIGCNPQTLYNYIEKRELKPNPEKTKTSS